MNDTEIAEHDPVKPKHTLANLRERINTAKHKLSRYYTKFHVPVDAQSLLQEFNFSQICYFVACLLLLVQFLWFEKVSTVVPGFLALVGLTRELLRLFELIWSYTIGKSFILVLYAGTANISLAYAAMQINFITGVEPTPFVFTLGFTTIVMLPFWIAVASMLFFTLSLAMANMWLLIRLPIRLLGIKVAIHWEDQRFPFITMLMRICLIPLVLVYMFNMASPYFSSSVNEFAGFINVNPDGNVEFVKANSEEAEEVLEQAEMDEADRQEAMQQVEEKLANFEQDNREKAKLIRSLIASFLFHFEAYPHSMCQKREEQRSVIIDENLALMVDRDDQAKYGYRFSVVRCEPDIAPQLAE